jgi:uncharacterized protein
MRIALSGTGADTPGLFSSVLIFPTMPPMATAATNRGEVIERCRKAEAEIRVLGVRRIALFGSMARGEARADSDVDLLVEFEPGGKSFDRFLALSDLLEHLLGRHVDLVTTEALSPYIGPHILAEAEDVVRAA